jgi:PTH2 family peptidyl-tRNA hydrolase
MPLGLGFLLSSGDKARAYEIRKASMLDQLKKAKQVIVMRRDLKNTQGHKVRTGKLIAQGAHASIKAYKSADRNDAAFIEWDTKSFTKITLGVDSLEELLTVLHKAAHHGLNVVMIEDDGTTEFGGKHTITCLGIGPHYAYQLDKATGDLKPF